MHRILVETFHVASENKTGVYFERCLIHSLAQQSTVLKFTPFPTILIRKSKKMLFKYLYYIIWRITCVIMV